jgi:hypothetical protein
MAVILDVNSVHRFIRVNMSDYFINIIADAD